MLLIIGRKFVHACNAIRSMQQMHWSSAWAAAQAFIPRRGWVSKIHCCWIVLWPKIVSSSKMFYWARLMRGVTASVSFQNWLTTLIISSNFCSWFFQIMKGWHEFVNSIAVHTYILAACTFVQPLAAVFKKYVGGSEPWAAQHSKVINAAQHITTQYDQESRLLKGHNVRYQPLLRSARVDHSRK